MRNWGSLNSSSSNVPVCEHEHHLFFDCSFSKEIWKEVLTQIGVARTVLQSHMEWRWIISQFEGGGLKTKLLQTSVAATVYAIWMERNNRIFQDAHTHKSKIIANILKDTKIRITAKIPKVADTYSNKVAARILGNSIAILPRISSKVSSKTPTHNWMMLNADGSLKDSTAGYGGVLRNEKGEVVMAYCAEGETRSVLYLELKEIAEGIHLARELGIRKLSIRSDSNSAVNIISRKAEPTWRVKELAQDIVDMLSDMEKFDIEHTFRQPNQVADYLANIGSSMTGKMFFCNPLQKEIMQLVCKDASGHLYTRI